MSSAVRWKWILASLVIATGLIAALAFLTARSPSSGLPRPVGDSPKTGVTTGTRPPAPPDLPRPATPNSNLEPFRQYSKQLVNGVVGFDYPAMMTVGERSALNLHVSVKKATQELRDALASQGRTPIVATAKLAPRMRADLQGFGFDIKPVGASEQLVDADEDTTWRWNVRALEAGVQRLTVTLTAVVALEGSEGTRDVSTFVRDVRVEAVPRSWSQRVLGVVTEYGPSRDVIWPAIPAAAAAIWAFLFARRKVKRRNARRKQKARSG